MGRLIALMLALAAGALVAWSQVRLPAPQPASAPTREFSAERALAVVDEIARTPHPIGSQANADVREQLFARMAALGLSPRLSHGDALTREGGLLVGASPTSLIGVLHGNEPSQPAIALVAHFDSRPNAPGAADDGAGVAAVLETVRALKAQGTPARDVVVILTDGEEACLCGAREVFAHDLIAHRLGLAINLEARGSRGRALMFQTGQDDAGVVRLFRDSAVRPMAGALFSEVYARLPNDTDFSVARAAGVAGLNYAFTGGAFDYHQPTDTTDHLAPGSLQDLGQQVLAAASAAAYAPTLPPAGPDLAYGAVFGRSMIVYPPVWGWVALAASSLLIAWAAIRARRREPFNAGEVARGAAAGLYALVGAASVLHLAQHVATLGDNADNAARRLLALAGRWEAAQLLLGVGLLLFVAAEAARGRRRALVLTPLVAAIASCLVARAFEPEALILGAVAAALGWATGRGAVSRPAAWLGVLLIGLLSAVGLQLAAPPAAYVLAWPLLLGAVAAAASDLSLERRTPALGLLALAAAFAVGWAGVHAHLVAEVVGLPELMALPILMSALTLWPLAQPAPGAPPARLIGRALLFAGAVATLGVRLPDPWNDRRPQASFVAYHLDQDTGHAWRVAFADRRTAWSDSALAAGGAIGAFKHWVWDRDVVAAPTAPAHVSAPDVVSRRGADGLIHITVRPPAGTEALWLQLSPDTPATLEAAGQAQAHESLPPGRWTRLDWWAPPADGLTLTLRPAGPGTLSLRYAAILEGWAPGLPTPAAPPPTVMAAGLSGQAWITGTRRIRW